MVMFTIRTAITAHRRPKPHTAIILDIINNLNSNRYCNKISCICKQQGLQQQNNNVRNNNNEP